MNIPPDFFALAYLVSAVLFILGLKGLTSPATARRGNYFAMAGMFIAVAATLSGPEVKEPWIVLPGLAVGAAAGIIIALKIKMTAMPQLVAALHSFVGLAAGLVAIGVYLKLEASGGLDRVTMIEISAGAVIGLITFTGSLVAFGKLQALIGSAPLKFRGQHLLNLALLILIMVFGYYFVAGASFPSLMILCAISLVLGVLLITPIGGADMPVVISMLNSYSGWAAAATGFTLDNKLLIITGALVGCSGAILSYIMCKAMNRSIVNVVLGGYGGSEAGEQTATSAAADKGVKSASVEEAAYWMDGAAKVIVVPGYGMAVAQAQHAVKELMLSLEKAGAEVKFAIHPVAGRMPGHMNVLLAEADIPYDRVFEMDEINPEFSTADVALVVGANDVTNPAARLDKSSPIYGMPILEVEKATHIFVIKRSMRPGYSGIDNLLYYMDNCSLIFGDAKQVCEELTQAFKSVRA